MTLVRYLVRDGHPVGFRISGHSGAAPRGQDIVCAAVSSAAQLAANTAIGALGCRAVARQRDGYLLFSLLSADAPLARPILEGLRTHMTELARQYPAHLRIVTLEV